MKGIIKVFQAKRYLGNFASKRTMVWVADVRGLDGNIRQLTCSVNKAHVLSSAASEVAFTGFSLVQAGRDTAQDSELRE